MLTKVKNAVHGAYVEAVNQVTTVQTVSTFLQDRKLTPDEFVKAGDYLVSAFPSWQWSAGDPKRAKNYLPLEKQYLIIKKVRCLQRASEIGKNFNIHDLECDDGDDDGWVATEMAVGSSRPSAQPAVADESDEDDVAAAPVEPESGDVRYYDLHMTWDKYYSVPRFWLVGHSMDRTLSADEVFEDVSADHAGNTITWDRHPHEIYSAASIHPCRHASTMKKLGDLKVASGEEFLVDHYLLLFLKFIQSIIPTIAYDYTMEW